MGDDRTYGHTHAPTHSSPAFAIGVALGIGVVAVEAASGLLAHALESVAGAGHIRSDALGLLLACGVGGLVGGTAATLWRGRIQAARAAVAAPPTRPPRLLARAAPLLRLPTSPDRVPAALDDGSGLRCPVTGRVYPYRDGILDLLGGDLAPTRVQRLLDTPLTAWGYERIRSGMMRAFGLPAFPAEVAAIQRHLAVRPGDAVLDLACGHGNFTVEWAKRAGPDGLVIGLDISMAMLARAARRVADRGLDNVLLIRGDALRLPLADASVAKANCSGGFHQLPDLPRALRELARVSAPGAALTASTFASEPGDRREGVKRWIERRSDLHFVPLDWLGEQALTAGYRDYRWSLPGGWFGYVTATKGP